MRPIRSLAVLVLVGVGLVLPAGTAVADCETPVVVFEETAVGRGDPVRIVGRFFGTACNDGGYLPEGEGTLGVPQPEIEVYVVQGKQTSAEPNSTADISFETEILVATGSANDDFAFGTEIYIPETIEPGPAGIIARWGESGRTFSVPALPLTVRDVPVTPDAPGVVTFGPVRPDADDTSETTFSLESDVVDDTTPLGPIVIAVVAALVVVGLTVWLIRRHGRSRSSWGRDGGGC